MRVNPDHVRRQVLDLIEHASTPTANAGVGVDGLFTLPDEVQAQIRDLEIRIARLEEDKDVAVAEHDFLRAIRLREEAAPLKSLRNDVVHANLPLSKG
jgi:hypothetical protein